MKCQNYQKCFWRLIWEETSCWIVARQYSGFARSSSARRVRISAALLEAFALQFFQAKRSKNQLEIQIVLNKNFNLFKLCFSSNCLQLGSSCNRDEFSLLDLLWELRWFLRKLLQNSLEVLGVINKFISAKLGVFFKTFYLFIRYKK